MFGVILKSTNSSFQKGITFCRSIYVKKVMKLLAFIFEQPSYILINPYKPSILFVGQRQTMQTQIRRYRMLRLIRVSTLCHQNVLSHFE